MGDGRRWKCQRRRRRPGSPCQLGWTGDIEDKMYLCASIAWDRSPGVVPQAFMRSSDWLLIVVGVGKDKSSKASASKKVEQHDSN